MAIPTSYTEETLMDHMLSTTEAVAEIAGVDSYAFEEAVNDTLTAYGAATIDLATNIAKLRALAKVEAWKTLITYLMTLYDFTADGASYKRSQMLAAAEAALSKAEADAALAGYSTVYSIEMGTMVYSDPYSLVESADDYAT